MNGFFRRAVGAAFVLSVGATAHAEPTELDSGDVSVTSCIRADAEADGKGVRIRLHNDCETNLSCKISWELKCGGADADGTPHSKTTPVWSQSQGTVRASAESCPGEDWMVDSPAWHCSPTQ